jgi:hypothetical protein
VRESIEWHWVAYAIVLAVLVLVGLDVHNEMIPALEQCAPNCELRG